MKRLSLAIICAAIALSGCLSSKVPPEQRRGDDRWRQTSEMLSRPPTDNF